MTNNPAGVMNFDIQKTGENTFVVKFGGSLATSYWRYMPPKFGWSATVKTPRRVTASRELINAVFAAARPLFEVSE
jgi:hypothetical protein